MKQGIFAVICSNANSFSPGPISENELHSVKGGTVRTRTVDRTGQYYDSLIHRASDCNHQP